MSAVRIFTRTSVVDAVETGHGPVPFQLLPQFGEFVSIQISASDDGQPFFGSFVAAVCVFLSNSDENTITVYVATIGVPLGADAIAIGRPYIWGLGTFGQEGVETVLDILKREFEIVMRQAGTLRVPDINRGYIA